MTSLTPTSQRDPPTETEKAIRVLILEDRPADAEVILQELRRAGFAPEWQRVENEGDFAARLHPALDLILADYRLPLYDGLSALRFVQQRKLDIPFILISAVLSDEVAAQCIKHGVTDYLRKGHLDRLGLAVANALEERRLRADRKHIEEQLRQAQKLETIGQLAGGIAHDFNNVLCVINGRTSLLLEDPTVPPAARDSLKEIYTAGARAAALTRQLLFFSRRQAINLVPVNVNKVIEELAKMLGRLIGEHIRLDLELGAEVPPIEADAGMMEQILINLAVNARDAMPRGGRLVIATNPIVLSRDDVRDRPSARAGEFVCLQVADNGCGIPPEIMPRIFEPFFTTKGEGRGTGLGLSTVFGIVGQHHGWIDVSSRVNAGTRFSLYLPANRRCEPSAILFEPEQKVPGGNETILVVEDETSVREFAVAALQLHGYRVLQATSGRDAIDVWQRHDQAVHLLLTDMVMPDDVTGPELAAAMLAGNPALRVIFTSGYTPEMMVEVFAASKGKRFLHKPYQPRTLALAVREALDAPQP
ncbi:MAG TPA: response regulator [Opitutaceae bacterium]|nr:response regulator [Opitutaceae bacterium]